jgi:hypothetical protein
MSGLSFRFFASLARTPATLSVPLVPGKIYFNKVELRAVSIRLAACRGARSAVDVVFFFPLPEKMPRFAR